MDLDFKSEERGGLRLVTYFKKRAHQSALKNILSNLSKLRPLIAAADQQMKELAVRELHKAELVHKFKSN